MSCQGPDSIFADVENKAIEKFIKAHPRTRCEVERTCNKGNEIFKVLLQHFAEEKNQLEETTGLNRELTKQYLCDYKRAAKQVLQKLNELHAHYPDLPPIIVSRGDDSSLQFLNQLSEE